MDKTTYVKRSIPKKITGAPVPTPGGRLPALFQPSRRPDRTSRPANLCVEVGLRGEQHRRQWGRVKWKMKIYKWWLWGISLCWRWWGCSEQTYDAEFFFPNYETKQVVIAKIFLLFY